jgi:hypothetical protein
MKRFFAITATVCILIASSSFIQKTASEFIDPHNPQKRVIAIHQVELKENADSKAFETFVMDKIIPLYNQVDGQFVYLVIGDRGIRTGKYAVVMIFTDLETRDRIYPPSGGISADFEKILEGSESLFDTYDEYTVGDPWVNHTDYIPVTP